MAISSREAFKLGFLLKCAENGLEPDVVVKRAFGVTDAIGSVLGAARSFGGGTLGLAALGVPVGVGAAGGILAHKAMEKPIDEADVKDTEVADEYRRLARVARLNAKLKQLRTRAGLA